MPLSGNGAALGTAVAGAAGITIPPGPADCGSLGNALASWLTGHCITAPGTMVGAGGTVTGKGAIGFGSSTATDLGAALASSVNIGGVVDAATITAWTEFAQGIMDHVSVHGGVNPTGFAYNNTTGGAVTGTATVAFDTLVMPPPTMATRLGLSDAANIATFSGPTGISYQVFLWIQNNAAAASLGFTCPAGGGALVGASTIA